MNKCIDCGKEIGIGSKRCQTCAHEGKNAPNFKYNISKEELHNLYWNKNLNLYQIANKFKCVYSTICRFMEKYNIKKRARGEAHKGLHYNVKENHPNWIDDRSFKEYGAEFDNALKEQIRFRDKYKCQVCGCSQLENGRQLDCHHIDYDKKHNELNNLIALCHNCHMKTNGNKDYWYSYFTYIMEEKSVTN